MNTISRRGVEAGDYRNADHLYPLIPFIPAQGRLDPYSQNHKTSSITTAKITPKTTPAILSSQPHSLRTSINPHPTFRPRRPLLAQSHRLPTKTSHPPSPSALHSRCHRRSSMMRRTSPPPPAQKALSVLSTHLRRGPASPRSWRKTSQATLIRTEVSTSGYRARELCLSASVSGYSSSATIRSRSSGGRERSGKKEVAEGGVGFARVGVIEVR